MFTAVNRSGYIESETSQLGYQNRLRCTSQQLMRFFFFFSSLYIILLPLKRSDLRSGYIVADILLCYYPHCRHELQLVDGFSLDILTGNWRIISKVRWVAYHEARSGKMEVLG